MSMIPLLKVRATPFTMYPYLVFFWHSTTCELLQHLGWLMEEVVHGSQEKVGLAQAIYDSVRDTVSVLPRP